MKEDKNITTEESLVLCKKLDKFEKTFMELSNNITDLTIYLKNHEEQINDISLRYEFILDYILKKHGWEK